MGKLIKISAAVLLTVFALSGCAFSDPRIEGTPPPGPTVAADFEQAADEVHAAWNAVANLAASTGSQQWGSMADTLASQWLILTGPDPLHRISATDAIGDPTPDPSLGEGTSGADSALVTARDDALTQANASTGLATAFWAGLAAGLEQVRLGLTEGYDPATPADPTVTITILDEPTALSDLISQYEAGIFAIRSAMGFLAPADPDQSTFRIVLTGLQSDLSALTGMAASSEATPVGQGVFELPPGRDSAAAMALLATTQKSLTDASMVWAASSVDPSRATPYLMRNAALAMDYGLGTAAWPGWPDSV